MGFLKFLSLRHRAPEVQQVVQDDEYKIGDISYNHVKMTPELEKRKREEELRQKYHISSNDLSDAI